MNQCVGPLMWVLPPAGWKRKDAPTGTSKLELEAPWGRICDPVGRGLLCYWRDVESMSEVEGSGLELNKIWTDKLELLD